MSQNPFAVPEDAASGALPPPVPPGSPTSGDRRRGLRYGLAAGAIALLAAGGVGAKAALDWFTGSGGARPAEALPADTAMLATVDLDPAGSQKIDAVRFLMKLPDRPTELKDVSEQTDLRKVVFDAIAKEGGLGEVNYAADVEPWLGTRFGFALVPGSQGPGAVMVIPHTDSAKAAAGLTKITAGADDLTCDVGTSFALCGGKDLDLASLKSRAASSTLASSDTYAADTKELGTDHIAAVWTDMEALKGIGFGALGAEAGGLDLPTQAPDDGVLANLVKGHGAYALRFDGPHLEVVGAVHGSPTPWSGTGQGTVSLGTLPASTVAAMSMTGAAELLKSSFDQLDELAKGVSGDGGSMLAELEEGMGLSFTEDIAPAFGTDFTIALGGKGDGEIPDIAIRTDGDKAALDKIEGLLAQSGAPLETAEVGNAQLWSLSPTYLETVRSGSGLGESAAFTQALPDVSTARVALFVNLAEVEKAFGADMDSDDLEAIKAFSAVGLTVGGSGDSSTFRLRLTTR